MAELGTIPTGYERVLPPQVQLLVGARRRELARRATGRVLDLGGAESHRRLWADAGAVVLDGGDDPRAGELAGAGERFDTVVSVLQLSASRDPVSLLQHLRTLVGDEGCLLFLEPGRLVGASGRLQRFAARPVRLATGLHVDRDVVDVVRGAGLSVIALDRHRVPTLQPWLRVLVEGRAHRALPPGGRRSA